MNRTSSTDRRFELVLAATVFVATGLGGLVTVPLPRLPELFGVDMTSGIVLVRSVSTFIHALLPLGLVYVVSKRVAGSLLPAWAVTAISLTAAVLGRYVGTSLGYVLLGRQLPAPLVLVGPADFATGEFGVVTWVGVVLGVLGSGLWGTVGAFGGLGLARASSDPE